MNVEGCIYILYAILWFQRFSTHLSEPDTFILVQVLVFYALLENLTENAIAYR